MSDEILIVGKKGEIFTSRRVRERAGIVSGGRVRASVVEGKLIIEPIQSLKELLRSRVVSVTLQEAEEMSEEMQREAGIYG